MTYYFSLKTCVAFDVECYPNRWMVGFYWLDKNGAFETYRVDGNVSKLRNALLSLGKKSKTLVGYNSSHYDIPMLRAILGGRDAFEMSQEIVKATDEEWIDLSRYPQLGVDHIDLCARLQKGRAFPGLKTVAANLHRPKLQDLPYPPEQELTDAEWAEVFPYNLLDLEHTWEVLKIFAPELDAMTALSNEHGLDLRSTSKSSAVHKIFKSIYKEAHGHEPEVPGRPAFVTYHPPVGVVRPRTQQAAEWFDQVVDRPIPVPVEGPPRPIVPKAKFALGSLTVKVGSGGLHSIDPKSFHREDPEWEIWSADVASFYPALIEKKVPFPKEYGDLGLAAYRDILRRRLALKTAMRATKNKAERERLDAEQYGLKIILNATFGQFGNEFSTLFDPAALLSVTLSGQLLLIDLIERLQGVGGAEIQVLGANTDGVYFRARAGLARWREVLSGWERDTEMVLEIDQLECLLMLATNLHATRDKTSPKPKVKRKGSLLSGSTNPEKTANALVVNDAVVAAFFDGALPEDTIRAETRPSRFCSVTRRTKAVKEGVAVDGDGVETPLGKVTRWYKTISEGLNFQHRMESGKTTTPSKAKGVALAMDLSGGALPGDLDLNWYIAEARRIYDRVPGPHRTDPAMLSGLAAEVFDHGLIPYPKNGKALPKGTRVKAVTASPSYLRDWPRYPTIGTLTGPPWGILVIDVDDPIKWINVRGTSWEGMSGCLVCSRGDVCSQNVRAGRERGKLIFKLDVELDHPLCGLSVAHFKRKHGFDFFFGKDIPSILGAGPDDTTYQLEGTLSEPPQWLLDLLCGAAEQDAAKKKLAAEKRLAKKAAAQANGHVPSSDAIENYVSSAIDGEVARIEDSAETSRNAQVYDSGKSLGRFVGAGILEREEAEKIILEAAKKVELPEEEAVRAMTNGIERGIEKEWDPSTIGMKDGHAESRDWNFADQSNGETNPTPVDLGVIEAHTVRPEAVVWECKDRIAKGKFFLLVGEGADGKSQIATHISGAYSTGGFLFGLNEKAPLRDVLFCQAEDGVKDIVIPRLIAVKADLRRIKFVKPSRKIVGKDGKSFIHPKSFQDLEYWDELIKLYPNAGLLIADPIPAYIGKGVNDHRNADLRQVLDPFFDHMETRGITSIGITHVGKATDGRLPIHKILGSVAYANRARGAFGTGLDGDDPKGERRLLCHLKPFNAKVQPTLIYKVVSVVINYEGERIETSRVEFQEGTDHRNATEVMIPAKKKQKDSKERRKALGDWLKDILTDGPVESDEVKNEAKKAGFGVDMLWEVKGEIGVKALKLPTTGKWAWTLPRAATPEA